MRLQALGKTLHHLWRQRPCALRLLRTARTPDGNHQIAAGRWKEHRHSTLHLQNPFPFVGDAHQRLALLRHRLHIFLALPDVAALQEKYFHKGVGRVKCVLLTSRGLFILSCRASSHSPQRHREHRDSTEAYSSLRPLCALCVSVVNADSPSRQV